MTNDDFFGLTRESKINKSKVREIFTPHMPIQSADLFLGRQKEVQKIIEQINTPGQHSLLYGDRGVGKSSLANIATQLLISKLIRGKLYAKRCDSSDNFVTILEAPLADLGAEIGLQSTSKSHKQEGNAGIGVTVARAGIKSERSTTKIFTEREFTPSRVSNFLCDKHGLLYIDEADRIVKKEDKIALAELIKLLSDCGSPFKVLIVGIAETAEELTGAHPSVQRCLKETKLGRMSDSELELIITRGASKAKLEFDPDVVKAIVKLSSGYPHFTHLLALKCAEEAISSDSKRVTTRNLSKAIKLAVDDAEGTLRRQYQEAVRSYSTPTYRAVLTAAARLGRDEFTAQQLRRKIEDITGLQITQGGLNNYLSRLVSDDGTTILTRLAKGVYRFTDPRMPSYIKIANADLNE